MDKRFEKLPELIKHQIESVKELYGVSDGLAMATTLGIVNFAVMPHYVIDSEIYGIRPINTFILGISKTGGRKTSVYEACMVTIKRYEEEQKLRYVDEESRWRRESRLYESEMDVYTKKRREFDNDPTGTSPPTEPRRPQPMRTANYTTGKGTVNGLLDELATQPFIGLFSSEAGEFWNGHAWQNRDQTRSIEMTTFLTSAWDGARLERKIGRSGGVSNNLSLKNRSVSMLFLLQMNMIAPVLNSKTFQNQGFTHRLLIVQGEVTKQPMDSSEGSRDLRARIIDSCQPFNDRIYDLISQRNHIRPKNFIKQKISDSKLAELQDRLLRDAVAGTVEIDRQVMKLSTEAHLVLEKFNNDNMRRDETDLRAYAGFVNRLHEHAMRIAATISAFNGRMIVNREAAEAAVDIMYFFIEQRKLLDTGVISQNPELLDQVETLVEWMNRRVEEGKERSWTKNKIKNFVRWFRSDLTTAEQENVLCEVVEKGYCTVSQASAGAPVVYTWRGVLSAEESRLEQAQAKTEVSAAET